MKEPPKRAMDYSVGIDCEDIARWRRIVAQNSKLLNIFTDQEHSYCRSFKDPAPHYAVRWCAKEAILKAAAPFGTVDIRDIEINNDQSGQPYILIRGDGLRETAFEARLSVSHTRTTAVASVLLIVFDR